MDEHGTGGGSSDGMGAREGPGVQRLRATAAALLVAFGLLVLGAAVVGVRREAGLPTAASWTILHLVALLALAIGVLRAQVWAWWGAAVLAVIELLLLLPLVAALLGGQGITLLIPRLDLVLVVLEAAALVGLLVVLVRLRGRAGT